MNHWSKRRLTLSGRITVIKSLAISKLVHLFISLPAPPYELIKELEKLFYGFLWNSGPNRIKRKVIVKNIECAGLRMVDLISLIKALKTSWLRRILQHPDASSWKDLSFINFPQLFSVGGCYAAKLSSDLQNPFWKDLLHVWAEFCNILPVENRGQILESPLWYNENIGRGNFILKHWYDNGIRVVYDIVAENGELYTFEQFKVMYNIRGTFLDNKRMLNNISQSWKAQINDNLVFHIRK